MLAQGASSVASVGLNAVALVNRCACAREGLAPALDDGG